MNRLRWVLAMASVPGVLAAQSAVAPESQIWPAGGEAKLGAFGNLARCTMLACDRSASLGFDARITGPFSVAVGGSANGLQYGASYSVRHVEIATRIGGGGSIPGPFVGVQRQVTINQVLSVTGNREDTTVTTKPRNAEAIRWSSVESRATWREERWWLTALAGRTAVAKNPAAFWGGVQVGADVGRGVLLMLGAGTSSRAFAQRGVDAGRKNFSLGLGFNTAILSSTPPVDASHGGAKALAFTVTAVRPGIIRVAIRIPTPATASVELASDCTNWRPVPMTREGETWVAEVPAIAGVHRANVRVNGERWIAPPGLARVDDDFAGEVGIFVVE